MLKLALSIVVAAASCAYAGWQFLGDVYKAPQLSIAVTGVEGNMPGTQRTYACEVDRVAIVSVTASDNDLVIRAAGAFKTSGTCRIQIDISRESAHHGDFPLGSSDRGVDFDVNTTVSLNQFNLSPSDAYLIYVEVNPGQAVPEQLIPLVVEAVPPMKIVSSGAQSFGAGRNARRSLVVNERQERKDNLVLFVVSAVFGAAISIIFESLLDATKRRPKTRTTGA